MLASEPGKYGDNKNTEATITKGVPIALLVASSKRTIPIKPIIKSVGKL
jgi:hypothetical protein